MDVGPEYVAFEPARRSFLRHPLVTFGAGVSIGIAIALAAMAASMNSALFSDVIVDPMSSSSAAVTSKPTIAPHAHAEAIQPVPHKFAVHGVTPVTLQMARGTCWVFAAVAVLEHSYRMQGIARGYLDPDQYVRLSEQVFGIAVLDACSELGHNESCLIGDEVWVGNQLMPIDTQGGSPTMLYWLKSLERRAALPHSVCNYTETAGHDHECPGLAAALPANPLHFETRSITTLFDREDIKSALRRDGRVMSLSTGMVTVRYLLPCTRETADALKCDPDDRSQCVPCPLEPAFGGVGCCVVAKRESNTMGGEFFRLPPISHPSPIFEGGHAMALVGYSDVFRTRHGHVGGYILRNSWWDGLPPSTDWKHARGSHSLAWFMQTVSRQDEAQICPNSHDPYSWYTCGTLSDCRSRKAQTFARAMNQPLHLQCIDQSPYLHGLCQRGERYFFNGLETWGSGLTVGCFLKDDGEADEADEADEAGVVVNRGGRVGVRAGGGAGGGAQGQSPGGGAGDDAASLLPANQSTSNGLRHSRDDGGGSGAAGGGSKGGAARRPKRICSPPVPAEDLALVFAPVPSEVRPNHPDLCGFYFFPYELAETISAHGQGTFEVDDMEVVWSDASFAANAADYPDKDYSMLQADTYRQAQPIVTRPFLRDAHESRAGVDRRAR